MDLATIWDRLAALIASLPRSGLLLATLAAVAAGVAGTVLLRRSYGIGRMLRSGSSLALAGILVLVVLQMSRFDPRFDMAIPEMGMPRQVVEGGETRVPLAGDGHYWVRAEINGVPASFLIDTGATLTTLNEETARAAGLEARTASMPVLLETANGTVTAKLATIDELTIGDITARGLDAAIAPNIGKTNVLGMNMLARLGSWRVEQGTLILTAATPAQEASPPTSD